MASMTEQVQAHLDNRARNDAVFAEKMKNPRKSIGNCIKFIAECAMKYMEEHKDDFAMKGGYGGDIDDEICYGWANHYYDEENLDIDKTDEERKADAEKARLKREEDAKKSAEGKKAEQRKKAKEKRWAKNANPKVEQKSATDMLKAKKEEDQKFTKKELKSGADCFDLFGGFFS